MNGGVRAEIQIKSPPGCPIAAVSEAAEARTTCISKTGATADDAAVTEEFILDADRPVGTDDLGALDVEVEEVFTYRSERAYRFTRDSAESCLCDSIEQHDCPIIDVHADRGTIHVVFHASDMRQLRAVLTDLSDRWSTVTVKRLLRSNGDNDEQDYVLLDRSQLTERQHEVLKTAHELGYFEHGSGANAGEVAAALGISTSTFSEHLRATQRKLIGAVLDE